MNTNATTIDWRGTDEMKHEMHKDAEGEHRPRGSRAH